MAVTKIFPIHERLDQSVAYAANEEKTSLHLSIDYAANEDKTSSELLNEMHTNGGKDEVFLFQSALYCGSVQTAFEEMQITKKRYGKTGGVLGYHLIQSFKPGEITPELTHQLAIELAERVLQGRFEAVIGTHLNCGHLHSHIMINSVSFVDGKKFRCNMHTYFKEIQKISDDLCREHGLSVIEEPKGKSKKYGEWKMEKKGKPTIRSEIRKDVDYLISRSLNFTTFLEALKKSGYTVKEGRNVKHTAVKPPNGKRFIRLDSLGEDYTDDRIRERLRAITSWKSPPLPSPKPYHYKGVFKQRRKCSGLRAQYFHYLYLIRGARRKTSNRKVSRYLLTEVIKFERYMKQHQFLLRNGVDTVADLVDLKQAWTAHFTELSTERNTLYKSRKATKTPLEYERMTAEIGVLTKKMKPLRKELKLCQQVESDIEAIRKRNKECRKLSKDPIVKKREEWQRTPFLIRK